MRINSKGILKLDHGIREVPLLRVHKAQPVVSLDAVGPKANRLAIINRGFLQVAPFPQGIGQIKAGHKIIRPELYRLTEVSDRLIEITQRAENCAQIILNLDVVGGEKRCLSEGA